jgi:hypothetical protein
VEPIAGRGIPLDIQTKKLLLQNCAFSVVAGCGVMTRWGLLYACEDLTQVIRPEMVPELLLCFAMRLSQMPGSCCQAFYSLPSWQQGFQAFAKDSCRMRQVMVGSNENSSQKERVNPEFVNFEV